MSDPQVLPRDKALPCPFCGCQPEIEHWHGGGPYKHRIGCANEDCRTAPALTAESFGEVLSDWNTRAVNV